MNAEPLPDEAVEVVELKIPSKAEWVAVARLALAAVASRLRFSVDEIEDVKLAIAEACTVSIDNAASERDQIEIVCEADPTCLRIFVRDGQLRPADFSAPVSVGERTENLGVFLIRALMDNVEVTNEPGSGFELVMSKFVSN